MDNISKITKYFQDGENNNQQLGIEIEYFVCDKNGKLIDYMTLSSIMNNIADQYAWKKFYENEHLIGLMCDDYVITLEPAGQLEISIDTFEAIKDIENVYKNFYNKWTPVLEDSGYHLVAYGVFPEVESGELDPDDIPLIPKKRYEYMNQYFEKTGKHGKYMMRATASTQVSIDYSSMQDCMRKIRILQKLSPLLTLLMENQNGLGRRENWKPHLLRTQIWNDVDKDRCGYIPGSFAQDFSYEQYAKNIYETPFILLSNEDGIMPVQTQSAKEYLGEKELDFTEHLLTMFFYHIRLKKYIEIRFADSVSKERMLGYAALIKGLMYSETALSCLEELFAYIKGTDDLLSMEQDLMDHGYDAKLNGVAAVELLYQIYEIAKKSLSEEEKIYLEGVLTLPMLEYEYRKDIDKDNCTHYKSFCEYKEYMLNSTAKYHGRVARTMYLPKLFTASEVEFFRWNVEKLFGIFDKVIAEYEKNPAFRELFGFDSRLEALILREKNYDCNIPIARIDIFYNEQTKEYKFCEFNTDGSSAMNEDRELNNGVRLTKAYQDFTKNHHVETFELFDSWVEEFLSMYAQFAQAKGKAKTPRVAIVDFLEHATINEFKIFAEQFKKRGVDCEICDIRNFKYEGQACYTPSGMQVDAIYRRAVTSDIFHHYDEVGDFLSAVKANVVCLMGDFRTQIAHNKILYKILHLPEVQHLFSEDERRFIKAHVPYTVSLTKELIETNPKLWESVQQNKNNWIIKPEDSYGSLGVHAGVECESEEWIAFLKEALGNHYILQEFCYPYRLPNVEWNTDDENSRNWRSTSNLTGMFVYNGKLKGLYSRTSYDEMISTQYNEMTLPTMVVKA